MSTTIERETTIHRLRHDARVLIASAREMVAIAQSLIDQSVLAEKAATAMLDRADEIDEPPDEPNQG